VKAALARWREGFPTCEFPNCSKHPSPWRVLAGERQGIRLQGRWYCGPECFEKAARELYSQMLPAARRRQSKRHRVPLGLMLFSLGAISQPALQGALQAQKDSGSGRIGEWLRQAGAVSEAQVTTALAMQWSCPVFPLESHRRFLDCAQLIPIALLESARMVPVHYLPSSKFLYMAFAESIDHTTLYGVEQMLDCRTEPCVASESSLQRALEELRQEPRPPEVVFDSVVDPHEMASTARSYALQLGADDARIVCCGEYIWTRLESKGQVNNLLFQVVARA
jgi:hypothetical protein